MNLLGVLSMWNKKEEKYMVLLQILFFSGEECKPRSLSQASGALSAFSRRKGAVSANMDIACAFVTGLFR